MKLKEKIENRNAKVGVIGLGYVGLPLALEFVRTGFHVSGIDISKTKINNLKKEKKLYSRCLRYRFDQSR